MNVLATLRRSQRCFWRPLCATEAFGADVKKTWRMTMKTMTRLLIFASCLASLLLVGSLISGEGLVPTAQAREKEGRHRPRCSERTVKGSYAFALQGNVQGVGPIAASGTTTFDGQEQVIITGFINTTSEAPAIEATLFGTYTVHEDCTGSATFAIPAPGLFDKFTELRFEAVIVNRGEEIRYLITTPEIVFAGSSVRQFPKGDHE